MGRSLTALLILAAASLGLYAGMPWLPLPWIPVAHLVLTLGMLATWKVARRGGGKALGAALAAAVLFRLVLAGAPPVLSGEVYRYVWDGRVQAAGHHPYRYAPESKMRAPLRDATIFPNVDRPESPTVHPPFAEVIFAALAAAKLGVTGFKVATALADVGAIAALALLLRVLGRPREDVLLYAWNPLAVVETAWSGHVEPVGVLLVLLGLAAIVRGRGTAAAAALAGAAQTRLLPLLLVPGFLRRLKLHEVLVLVAVFGLLAAPYAVRGPAYGAGVIRYVHRGEHGSIVFPAVLSTFEKANLAPTLQGMIAEGRARWASPHTRGWSILSRMVWPQELARLTVGLLALGWALLQSFRPRLDAAHEARLALGGALLLAPALYPRHLLWVLPLAAAGRAGGWLLAAALIPLQYLTPGDVPWALRLTILLPAIGWMAVDSWRRRDLD